jgi:hypothetical protein
MKRPLRSFALAALASTAIMPSSTWAEDRYYFRLGNATIGATGPGDTTPVVDKPDRDKDTYPDDIDMYPDDPNLPDDTSDYDLDDTPDISDPEPGNPDIPVKPLDTDKDGTPDTTDTDDDNDGVVDENDVAPIDPMIPTLTTDTDGDGTPDRQDPKPFDPTIPVAIRSGEHRYWRVVFGETVLRIGLVDLGREDGDHTNGYDDEYENTYLPGGTISGSHGDVQTLNDHNAYDGGSWAPASGDWIQFEFDTAQKIVTWGYTVPADHDFEGNSYSVPSSLQHSDNGSTWTTVASSPADSLLEGYGGSADYSVD